MKKLIIFVAVLASAALIIALAHDSAFTGETTKYKKSAVIKIKIKIPRNMDEDVEFVIRDEDDYPGDGINENDFVETHPDATVIGTVYKCTGNSTCTVYCASGYCWKFCW
jgi:hypothetical protein